MLWVTPNRPADLLQVVLRQHKIIAATTTIGADITLDVGLDGTPVALTFHRVSEGRWPLTEDLVVQYRLTDWRDDLKTVHDAFYDEKAQVPLITP